MERPEKASQTERNARASTDAAWLASVRAALSRIYHDANNPLSIVSGNAQFLLELARMSELDEELVQPLQDIEEACQRIAGTLQELRLLREEIDVRIRS